MSLSRIHIVLVRPADPLNIGAVARAMKNCDLSRLTLVAPATEDWVTARRVAVHAEDLLAAPRVVPTLKDAVADAAWVVGTSSRVAARSLPPREVGRQAARLVGEGAEVALVFGGEESGLSNDDLLGCHALSCIPSGSVQPSFNLGQAVLLYAYETFVAHSEATGIVEPRSERATDRELDGVEGMLREMLTAIGFVDPDRPRHGVRDLAHTLRRAGLEPREARLWQMVLGRVVRALRRADR